jgi:hypothetical protein
MNETIMLERLLAQGYVLKDKLTHDNIIPFVQQYLKKFTFSSMVYLLVNVVVLLVIIYKFMHSAEGIDRMLTNIGLGVFLAVALIPVHEGIHGLAYTLLGAKTVKYKADIRKFVFYAIADKFVVNAWQFKMVAFAPFIVINSAIVICSYFVSEGIVFILLGMLLFHTGACSGDFGLASYLDLHRGRGMITFDDEGIGESYFLLPANTNRDSNINTIQTNK